jgi:lipopolysaccharide cholinephosphotransferase
MNTGIQEHQAVLLDLLTRFAAVCEREGFTWFVMFGTLLGAVRHGGFIPWDDDIDVVMPRSDYDRLRQSPELFGPPYFLPTPHNDPAAAPCFMRLRNSETTMIAHLPSGMTRGGNQGAYIDIMPLDDVPDAAAALSLNVAARQINKQMKASAALDENAGGELPDWKAERCYCDGGIAGQYLMFANRYEWLCSRYSACPYYSLPVLGGERGTQVFEKSWFAEAERRDFAGLQVPIPSGFREVLVASFPAGLLTPEKKWQDPHQQHDLEEAIIDMERPYRRYMAFYTNMLVGLEDKKVFIFGASDSLRIWLERYGAGRQVVCAFDNDQTKWGKTAFGLPVRSPAEIPASLDEGSRLIIASLYRQKIAKQLDGMGVKGSYYFVDGWKYE